MFRQSSCAWHNPLSLTPDPICPVAPWPDATSFRRCSARADSGRCTRVVTPAARVPSAVKVFRRSEGLAARAEREARTASKLTHPNIHTVVGVESDDDNAYLISELVVGERFDRSELTDEQAVRAIAAVADALEHAHSRGVIHRDVEAGQHSGVDRRRGVPDRLRHRPRRRRHGDHPGRAADGHAVLHGPRAGRRRAGIRRDRRVGSGADAVRAPRPDETLSRPAPCPIFWRSCGRAPGRCPTPARTAQGALRHALRALDHDPRKRPDAAELRDRLLAALQPEPGPEAERGGRGAARSSSRACTDRPASPGAARPPAHSAGRNLGSAAATTLYVLTAFPVYPTQWSLPLAAVLAAIAWFRPLTALTVGAVICVPAFWNLAEAAGLLWIGMAAVWIRLARDWGRNRRWRRCWPGRWR